MQNKKILIAFGLFFALFLIFFLPVAVRAYGNNGHTGLTKEITNLYNAIYDPDLTLGQMQFLIQGSADEDTAPRWINHFFDPITGKEWLGKRLQGVSEEKVREIAKIIFGKDPVSALNWVHNQDLQAADYRLYQGNRAFESAVFFYSEGNKDNAFYNLGHILHLIEDMAVPAHTRQDSHFDMPVPELFEQLTGISFDKGEPYENWAEKYTAENSELNIASKLKKDYTPICDSLDECLISLAKYSNNIFFSNDTIIDKDYKLPIIFYSKDIFKDSKIFRYYYDEENNILFRGEIDSITKILRNATIDLFDIHQAYWSNLSERAVLAGVEVIKYFYDQAEKAKNKEIAVKKPPKPSFLALSKGISPYGELAKTYRFAKETGEEFQARLNEAGKELVLSMSDFFNRLVSFNPFLAFTPPSFSIKETIFSEEIEGLPDPFEEEDSRDKTDEIITGIVEYMIGTGGPSFNFQSKEDIQEALDDIAEKIDIIRMQVELLLGPGDNASDNEQDNQENNNNQNNSQNTGNSGGGGGGGSGGGGGGGSNPVVYPKILISEIQTAGLTDEKEEFVELYNPNNEEVVLTSWYLHRKTETGSDYSTFASNTLFSGKKIVPKGYFLIARQESSFVSLADIITDNSLGNSGSSSSLVIKNPNGEISDKLGFGQGQDYESVPALSPGKAKSLGRKLVNETEQDTDNNLADFEIQNPTPKAKNTTFVEPPAPLLPNPTDITAPQISFSLSAIQTSLTFTINFVLVDPITTVSPSGVDSYIFRWKEEEIPPAGEWQEDAPVKVLGGLTPQYSASREFIGEDEKTYYFQIKTKDVVGNESDWQPETLAKTKISVPKKILINEIQIDSIVGTGGADDDWVELYNPNNVDVSLAGWSIQRYSKKTPCAVPEKPDSRKAFSNNEKEIFAIPAKGFYLIVSTQASADLQAKADMLISWSLTDNNTIHLVRNENNIESSDDPDIVDKVGFGEDACFAETEPALNLPEGKSIERKKIGADTDDNSADFRIAYEPTSKGASPKISIEDATNYPADMGSSLPGTIYYFLKIKWQAAGGAAGYYDAQYKKNGGDWQNWLAQTIKTEETLRTPYSLLTDNIYHFRARMTDTEGNTGDWQEIAVNLINPVVINEVAYFGTNSSREDQWIELHNRNNEPIDLTGWRLSSYSASIELSGIIPAKGYFILERNDDNVISALSANQIFTGSLLGGNNLYLYNKNNRYIDQAYIPSGGWGGDQLLKEGNYYTVERISPYSFGIDPKNWVVNDDKTINGKDRNENLIYGTPASSNSLYQIYTSHYLSFVENTVLKKSLSPYLFWGNNVFIFEGFTLTIEPGTVIKFYDSQSALTINGVLKAIGTTDEKIIFTSFRDDEYGGDSNNDGSDSQPAPGVWLGVEFSKTSSGSEIENAVFRYGGAYFSQADFGAAIKINQCSVSLRNSVLWKNANNGLWLINSLSIVDSAQFAEHIKPDLPQEPKAVFIQGGSPEIKNSRFQDNYYAIYINKWSDSEGINFYPMPNLHTLDLFDPEKNTFMNSLKLDIFDASIIP
ncbi:MAG: parallel beta-helix repeat-containing protein [Parcubacteria group bacterium Licking1014_1]|nr:MAG: parallel beta-helix repeat-containing protein [Parcubacteria group bacterium Licking1014_1]